MEIGMIEGCTRIVGEDQGLRGLPLLDVTIDVKPMGPRNVMHSAWLPSAEELARLNAGAAVVLAVVGMVHPAVMIDVGAAPGEEEEVPAEAPSPALAGGGWGKV